MLTLNIRLSAFRLSASTPSALPKAPAQLRLCTTTHRLRAVDSPNGITSVNSQSPAVSTDASSTTTTSSNINTDNNSNPPELVFPASFAVAWTEMLPDHLALRATMLTIALRVTHKARFSAAICAPTPTMRSAAELSVPLRDLAVSTVAQSLRMNNTRGRPSNLTLSFHAVIDCPANIRLSMADLRLAAKVSPVGERFPLNLTFSHTGSGKSCTAEISSSHTHSPSSSAPSPSAPSRRSHTFASPQQNSNIPVNHSPAAVTACSWMSEHSPDLLLQASNLYNFAHSKVVISLTSQSDFDETPAVQDILLSASIPLYDIWAAFIHPFVPYRHTVLLSPSVSLTISFCAGEDLPLGQMIDGVTTNTSIIGAKPVTYGSELLIDRLPLERGIPPAWARVVDSFGTPYFHHRSSAITVWTPPHDDAVNLALRTDELRAEQRGFDRCKRGVFVQRASGAQCWRHPDALPNGQAGPVLPVLHDKQQQEQQAELSEAKRVFARKMAASGSGTAEGEGSPRTSFSLSTVDCVDVHPASLARRHDDTRPEENIDGTSLRPPVVELHWKMLEREGFAPRDGTEGHTLVSVLGGHKLIKFGGATGSLRKRTNFLDIFDVESMKWEDVSSNGTRPIARTGHAATAMGSNQERMVIFGGSSSQGRLNDVNVYNVENGKWSPLSVSGPVPAARARSGMTVTQDGATALMFGGRSIYRYLGGKYFDPLFVNALHAERGVWEQLRPRGSGPRPAPRSGCVVEFINNRQMFVHGGYDDGDRFFDDTFVFDLASCTWQKLGPFEGETCPPARESHASTVVDGDVVICGGTGDELFLGDVQVFDAGRMRWCRRPRTVGPGPGKIGGGAMATTHDGRAVFVGGEDGWSLSRRTHVMEISHRSVVPVDALIEAVRERGPDAGRCVVCMDNPVTTMFLWCGHSVCCHSCAPLVRNVCPVCRKPFSRIESISLDGGEGGEDK